MWQNRNIMQTQLKCYAHCLPFRSVRNPSTVVNRSQLALHLRTLRRGRASIRCNERVGLCFVPLPDCRDLTVSLRPVWRTRSD